VPRIPVSIELREYAQWFGALPEHEPRGILPYFAMLFGKGLCQTVHAGTLKRAFGSGRWFFVFDGLDEVPGDVKEGVSAEVQTFIDDILIGCSSDALSVCTSRPQGYSGQFTVLDPATVELAKLSPKQALDCAAPILAIDRSPGETALYLATLSEAIQSPAIQEIMTTPLQSHIMAVVVRDGGRPPERKWLLFTNFYQVIKKREANRNLPDKRLSALLREGDQLLKALHNRLGFELHARAETSEGAQTSLDRSDLRKIVRETVALLQDTQVEATVETLMNATTERLVLVNTPESGEKVRFDIRPLQEFFAAEYIYDSIAAETFTARIGTVAGDSHWREVLHFLLSGLVENGRHTEMTVAVEALTRLNEDVMAGNARALSRRLALGGIIAARLLEEGVLEQDKRVRQQFRKCFEPLFASLAAAQSLDGIDRANSKAFLQDALIDALLEQSEAENIGAAVVLALRLNDNHPRLAEVRDYFASSSISYQSAVLQSIKSDEYRTERAIPLWVLEWAFRTLLSPTWTELGAKGINSAFALLTEQNRRLTTVATRAGLDKSLLPIALAIFRKRRSSDEGSVHEFGNLQIRLEATSPELRCEEWSDVWSSLEKAPGIFELFYRSFRVAKDRTPDSVKALAKLGERVTDAAYLTSRLARYFPSKLLSWNFETDEAALRSCIEQDGVTSIESIMRIPRQANEGEWRDLLVTFPEFAIEMLFEPFFTEGDTDDYVAYLTSGEGARLLFEICDKDPSLLLPFVGRWAKIFAMNGKLRSVALKATCGRLRRTNIPAFFRGDAFEVDLPSEASLLPYIVQMLTVTVFARYIGSYFPDYSVLREGRINQVIAMFVPDEAMLLTVMDSALLPPYVCAAAAMLYVRHPGANVGKREACCNRLVQLYSPETGFWFLPAAAFALDELVKAGDTVAISVVSNLLEVGRRDFDGRLAVEPMLKSWREIARAPVQNSRASRIWDAS
jgi:hypothetical protein